MVTEEELEGLFWPHDVTSDHLRRMDEVRDACLEAARTILRCTKTSADQTAAVRKLREGAMTAVEAIASEGPIVEQLYKTMAEGRYVKPDAEPTFKVGDWVTLCEEVDGPRAKMEIKSFCEMARGPGATVRWHSGTDVVLPNQRQFYLRDLVPASWNDIKVGDVRVIARLPEDVKDAIGVFEGQRVKVEEIKGELLTVSWRGNDGTVVRGPLWASQLVPA